MDVFMMYSCVPLWNLNPEQQSYLSKDRKYGQEEKDILLHLQI